MGKNNVKLAIWLIVLSFIMTPADLCNVSNCLAKFWKLNQTVEESLSKFQSNESILYAAFQAYHQMEPDTTRETTIIEMMEHAGHRLDQLYECKGLTAEKEERFADAYALYCRAFAGDPTDRALREYMEKLEREQPEIIRPNGGPF